jgi:hypothetical protein
VDKRMLHTRHLFLLLLLLLLLLRTLPLTVL